MEVQVEAEVELELGQAEEVKIALERTVPDAKDLLEDNFRQLKSDLLALQEKATRATTHLSGTTILASHPVYQYLARRYGLNLLTVVWEPDAMPNESQWETLQALLEEQPLRFMLWEAEPLSTTRDRLQALGVVPIVFRPAMNRPVEGDFLSVMTANADSVRRATDATH